MNEQTRRIALLGASTKTLQFAAAYGALLGSSFETANEAVRSYGTTIRKTYGPHPNRLKMIDKDEREIRKKRRKKSEASRKRNRR